MNSMSVKNQSCYKCLNKKWLWFDYVRLLNHTLFERCKELLHRMILLIAVLCLCHWEHSSSWYLAWLQFCIGWPTTFELAFDNSTHGKNHIKWEVPIAGIGQGNGAGPHIWAVVSYPLLQVMKTDGFLAQFCCAMSKYIICFAVVDSMDLCVSGSCQQQASAIASHMQHLSTPLEGVASSHRVPWFWRKFLVPSQPHLEEWTVAIEEYCYAIFS